MSDTADDLPETVAGARADDLRGRLHVVATPIGNLADLSPRAAAVLAGVDVIHAEDTRHTGRLLRHLGITTPTQSLHEHNEDARVDEIVAALLAGASAALVSDAGTPAVSDPGYGLVRGCIAAGVPVIPVPGPSAVLAALVGSGLATDRFSFEGFLPRKGRARSDRLAELADEVRTMVLFVSPHRAVQDLQDLRDAIGGDRLVSLGREMTKRFEEHVRGSLDEVLGRLGGENPKGELTLVIDGRALAASAPITSADLALAVAAAVQEEGLDRKAAIKAVALRFGVPKRVAYQAVLDADAGSSSSTTT